MVKGKLASWEKKRATMKDAAAKIREGMSREELIAILGRPDSGGDPYVEYIGNVAAIDSLRVYYQNGRASRVEMIPNAAVNNSGR